MTLFYLGLAWLTGVALARWLEPPLPALGLLAVPALAALLLYRRERGPRLAAVCALALLAGAERLLWATPHFGPDDLAYYNDQGWVRLVGVVADEPDVRDTYQNLRLRAESLTIDQLADARPVKGTVLVRAPRYPARAYGERLAVTGELETPPIFEGFDYRDYLAHQRVYSVIRRSRIELIEAAQGSPFGAALYAFKAHAQVTIAQILPEPYAALLTGILLGVETGISPRPMRPIQHHRYQPYPGYQWFQHCHRGWSALSPKRWLSGGMSHAILRLLHTVRRETSDQDECRTSAFARGRRQTGRRSAAAGLFYGNL